MISLLLGSAILSAYYILQWPELAVFDYFNAPSGGSLDYHPLYPLFAYVLLGIILHCKNIHTYEVPNNVLSRFLSLTGQYALLIYLLHQPLLIALLASFTYVLTT